MKAYKVTGYGEGYIDAYSGDEYVEYIVAEEYFDNLADATEISEIIKKQEDFTRVEVTEIYIHRRRDGDGK